MTKPATAVANRSSPLWPDLLAAFPCCEPAGHPTTADLVSGRTLPAAETIVDPAYGPAKRVAALSDPATFLKLPIQIPDGPPYRVPAFTAASLTLLAEPAANLQVLNLNLDVTPGPLTQVRTFATDPARFALTDYRSTTYATDPAPYAAAYTTVFVWDGTVGTWYGSDGVTVLGHLSVDAPRVIPVYWQPLGGPGTHTVWAYVWGTALSAELRKYLTARPYDVATRTPKSVE